MISVQAMNSDPFACTAGRRAFRHAWLAVEIALAGKSVWRQIAHSLPLADGNVFGQHMEALRDLLSLAGFATDEENTGCQCREAIRRARQSGILSGERFPLSCPALGAAEEKGPWQELLANPLQQAGYPELSRLVRLAMPWGEPLFPGMVEYFLGRELRGRQDLASEVAGRAGDTVAGWWRCLESAAALLEDHAETLAAVLDRSEQAAAASDPEEGDSQAAERLFQLGLDRYFQGDYAQATVQFTAALKRDPARASFYAHRGDAYRFQGAYERAIADFHVVIRLGGASPAVLISRAMAYQHSGEYERARADCDVALEISPSNATGYRVRAASNAQLGCEDAAIADLSRALELEPADHEARYRRGVLYTQKKNYTQAIADFDQVLAGNRRHAAAYLYRGHAHRGLGQHGRAIADYSRVLHYHPSNALAYSCRGLSHRLQGDLDRAIADYTEALRLEPANARVYYCRAVLYRTQARLDEALADLDEALRHEPQHWAARYHRSKILLAQGRPADALADLTHVLSLNPTLVVAYLSRALIHDLLGQYREGIDDGSQAVALGPACAAARLVRGSLYSHAGNYAAAIEDLTEALRLDDQLALAYHERGVACTLQGTYEQALGDCNRLLALEPGNAQGYANRSLVYHFLGQIQEALLDYSRAVQLDPRCILSGWNQGLAEETRLRSVRRLADYIDGLQQAPPALEIPPPTFRVVIEPPPSAPEATSNPQPASEPEVETAVEEVLFQAPERSSEDEEDLEFVEAAAAGVALPPSSRPQSRVECPACHRASVPSSILPGGRVRCGICKKVFTPSPAPSPSLLPKAPLTSLAKASPRRHAKKPPAVAACRSISLPMPGRKGLLAAVGVAALLLLGWWYFRPASAARLQLYPARGKADFEGMPIANANVVLEPAWPTPMAFPRPHAVVKEDGSFVVGTYGKEDGVPAGEYKILVTWLTRGPEPEVEGGPLPENTLPQRYARFETSGLRVRIEARENQLPPLQLTR